MGEVVSQPFKAKGIPLKKRNNTKVGFSFKKLLNASVLLGSFHGTHYLNACKSNILFTKLKTCKSNAWIFVFNSHRVKQICERFKRFKTLSQSRQLTPFFVMERKKMNHTPHIGQATTAPSRYTPI